MIVEVWGIYPPPIGGVSIHIKRLIIQLNRIERVILKDFKPKRSYPFDYIFPVNNPIWEIIRLPFIERRLIHVEQFSYALFALLLLFGWKHKLGFTVHNQRSVLISSKAKIKLCALFFKRCCFLIMNDGGFKPKFAKFFNLPEEKIHILPAFLPPNDVERDGLPFAVKEFRQNHEFLISANAYKLRIDNGVDVYGLDMLIGLISELRGKGIDAGLLFCLPEVGDIDYYAQIKRRISELQISKHVFFVEGVNANGFEYWEFSDLFIRPTCTDMEGISVKEALCMGRNVIASDVCIRPKECILFKSRNEENFLEKTLSFYRSGKYKTKIEYKDYVDVAKETLKIYKSIG